MTGLKIEQPMATAIYSKSSRLDNITRDTAVRMQVNSEVMLLKKSRQMMKYSEIVWSVHCWMFDLSESVSISVTLRLIDFDTSLERKSSLCGNCLMSLSNYMS